MASVYDLVPKKLFEVPRSDTTTVCNMCHLPAIPMPDRPNIDAGPLYQYAHSDDESVGIEGCTVYCTHYLCMLASPGVRVLGEDHEGIKGILPNEMMKEWRRGGRLKCIFCGLKHATIGCSFSKCRNTFHLPCGIANGCNFQFHGGYTSSCHLHSEGQKIYDNLTEELLNKDRSCGVCLEELQPLREEPVEDRAKHLHGPCCGGWFHLECIKYMAKSAGYFFKCPFCNNNTTFLKEMKSFGIFVPQQDASWELEGGQFEELEERHSICDSEACLCPKGREFEEDFTHWEVILCKTCGSQGIHVKCAGLTQNDELIWKCETCRIVLEKIPTKINWKFSHINRRIPSKNFDRKCHKLLKSLKISIGDKNLKFSLHGRNMNLEEKYFNRNPTLKPVNLGPDVAVLECQTSSSQSIPLNSISERTQSSSNILETSNKFLQDRQIFLPPIKNATSDSLSTEGPLDAQPVAECDLLRVRHGEDSPVISSANENPLIPREKLKKRAYRKRKQLPTTPQPHKRIKCQELPEETSQDIPASASPSSESNINKHKLMQTSIFRFFAKAETPMDTK